MAVNTAEIEDLAFQRIINILRARPELIEKLALVGDLRLPDAWIGAGLIRNAVWDAVSGAATPQPPFMPVRGPGCGLIRVTLYISPLGRPLRHGRSPLLLLAAA
jgi:hypothetical protein